MLLVHRISVIILAACFCVVYVQCSRNLLVKDESLKGIVEADYMTFHCAMNPEVAVVDPIACLNEGLSSPIIEKVRKLAQNVIWSTSAPLNDTSAQAKSAEAANFPETQMQAASKLIHYVWGQDQGIWLAYTLEEGVQFGILNCTYPTKADRPDCMACNGCERLLYVWFPEAFNDNEYRMYPVADNGDVADFNPAFVTSGNDFDPRKSDAHKEVEQTKMPSWIRYWNPKENLATFAAPILKSNKN